ncbi:MAG: PQQ-binding-like beta-propeller repeat protein [Acidobacteriota bacterium]|nr:PQQ-binding-like beta-propeller repeat protein [Acidobacteriota bacterium]
MADVAGSRVVGRLGRARPAGRLERHVYTASPVAADGKVYLVSEDGETIALSAGRIPKVLARNTLDARQLASPAVAGGGLFIRSDDAVYAIGK